MNHLTQPKIIVKIDVLKSSLTTKPYFSQILQFCANFQSKTETVKIQRNISMKKKFDDKCPL
jgi:hypothetical protein